MTIISKAGEVQLQGKRIAIQTSFVYFAICTAPIGADPLRCGDKMHKNPPGLNRGEFFNSCHFYLVQVCLSFLNRSFTLKEKHQNGAFLLY